MLLLYIFVKVLLRVVTLWPGGAQAAYGIMAEVEAHPLPLDEMLFMDWRSEHLSGELLQKNAKLPTFLYAMPFTPTRIFLEETSLVARPAVRARHRNTNDCLQDPGWITPPSPNGVSC